MTGRTDRNERLFGSDGQAAIAKLVVVIAGLGGLGSHVAQQLAYLGVRIFRLLDPDVVTASSLNRLIGAVPDDVERRSPKVAVGDRQIAAIQPGAAVECFPHAVDDERAVAALDDADIVIGCLDNEPARLQLLTMAMARGIPYLDLATEIYPEAPEYGGRLIWSRLGRQCLSCIGALDQEELRVASMDPEQRAAYERTYGLNLGTLGRPGPSVVSINGVVAALGVTELMVWATGLREPFDQLAYRGHAGALRRPMDPPTPSCYYCGRTPAGQSTEGILQCSGGAPGTGSRGSRG